MFQVIRTLQLVALGVNRPDRHAVNYADPDNDFLKIPMSLQMLIDRLLFEEEGNTLDFKAEQYRFSGATDNEKSELLKDIIAFSNAWRRTDAYILIGVKEIKGGRSEIVGISEHIDDARLQQFINSKTQRPIDFSYKTVQHEDAYVGIFHIPVQIRRPFYLKKDFGRLKKDEVYIRRSSSTDVASPDEISTMGIEASNNDRDIPSLEVFLIRGKHNEVVEKRIDCKLINAKIPDDEQFPDYVEYANVVDSLRIINGYPNRDYYRKYAKYFQVNSGVHSFKLGVKNSGAVAARDVKVIFHIASEDKTSIVCKPGDLPNKPRQFDNILPPTLWNNAIGKVPDVTVKSTPHGWRITCYLGKIQPKDMAITKDYFCLGAVTSKSIQINLQVFSDDLPEPKQETLEVSFEVENRVYSVSDFLPKKKD